MTIVLERTLSSQGNAFGPFSLHANFLVNGSGPRVVDNNNIRAFSTTSTTFSRNGSQDVSLTGHPSSIVTWGFTTNDDDDWVILTRETHTGGIGRAYVYSADGTDQKVTFNVPNSVSGISGETFRAPKTISYWQGYYYVRVVRSVSGNMRFLAFDAEGNFNLDKSFLIQDSVPSSLRDAASSGDSPLYILTPGSSVGIAYPINPQDGSEVSGERLVRSEFRTGVVEGISVYDSHLYVASVANIYVFSGIVELTRMVKGSGGGGFNFGLFSMLVTNGIMESNMNMRNRRRLNNVM